MANGTKEFRIVINGITESVSAVDSLNKQLNALEQRINKINSMKVSSGVSGSSSRGSNTALSEEEAAQREINKLKQQGAQLDAKIAAAQTEVYKRVEATKDLYKEVLQDQKAIGAQERLNANTYSNTMAGVKQHLADLKANINITDLGDADKIKEMTKEANELTNKLKQMEQAYGQFGRNVGNYADGVAQGMKNVSESIKDANKETFDAMRKVTVNIAGMDVEFENLEQAAGDMEDALKAMHREGKQGTKEYQDMAEAVHKLQLELKASDEEFERLRTASPALTSMLHTMESMAAVGTMSSGLASLFGIDDSEIQKSIQKMVAFQNVLQGLQTINEQISNKQGIGKWIAPFTVQIDKATAKLLKFNTAMLGTGKAASIASKGIKLFSTALKGIASAGILIALDLVVEGIMKLIEKFTSLSDAEKAQKEIEESMADAYGKSQAKLIQYKAKLDNFNGSKEQEKKLVEECNREFGETLGTYKSVSEWQDVLKNKGEAYIKTLTLQAKAQAILNAITAAYSKAQQIDFDKASGEYESFYNKMMNFVGLGKNFEEDKNEIDAYLSHLTTSLENVNKEIEKHNKENKLGNYAPQIKENGKKSSDALKKSQETMNQLELKLMKEGLNKKLRQLDEEKRQTINKIKENGRNVGENVKKVEMAYSELRLKEIQTYLKSVEESVRKTARELSNIQFSLDLKDIDNEINNLQNKLDELGKNVPKNMTLSSRADFKGILGKHSQYEYAAVRRHNLIKDFADNNKTYDEYYSYMYKYISQKNDEIKAKFNEIYDETIGSDAEKKKAQYSFAEKIFQDEFRDVLDIIRDYGENITNSLDVLTKNDTDILNNSFKERLKATNKYWRVTKELIIKNLKEQSKLKEEAIKEQAEKEFEAERERYRNQYNSLSGQANTLANDINGFTPKNSDDESKLKKMNEDLGEIYRQMETAATQHSAKMAQINDAMLNAIKKNTIETNESISSEEEKYFSTRLSDYRDFQSKLNDELSRNPVTDKAGFGIVNIKQTKKNYEEILKASKTAIDGIKADKDRLDSLYKGGFIDKEAYNSTLRQLNEVEKEIKNGTNVTAEYSKQLVGDFIASINQYVQVLGQSIQDIMSSIWDYQDYQFEKEQEELDKWNEELDEKLDEQKEIVEKHKSAIDDIEDELASSRGDRRQHLIDQLNAEMAAQRAAQAEEKKIQKQKEAAAKKQEDLEKERRKEEYQRNVTQAFISWHMAIANGLATQPFMPLGIAMGALATVLGGVQYALVKSQKPYAKGGQLDGGVAVGKRHSEGGIPVLGGRASIEGGEFITNRVTTAKNVELLDFINSKKKRVNLDDLIDFYGTAPKKTIKSVRTKFEDGGYMPVLPNTLDVRDQLQNVIINQDNRPIYVSVVDINNKQEDVRRVQTLAGL